MTSLLVLTPAILSALSPNSSNSINCLSQENRNRAFVVSEKYGKGEKCLVDPSSVFAVSRLGWNVKHEMVNGMSQYYYIASEETPKIKSVSLSNSTLDKLKEELVNVENTAITYQALNLDGDLFSMDNNSLGYLRSFNDNYVSSSEGTVLGWAATAGIIDSHFVDFADTIKDCKSYFSSFVSKNQFCSILHGKYPYKEENKSHLFKDPITSYKGIDLLHLFASIDGTYHWTLYNATKKSFVPCIYPSIVHDLATWAGDLQTASKVMPDNPEDLKNFVSYDNIMDGNYNSSEEDILADMDALNITSSFLIGPGRISDAIDEYYGSVHSMGQRKKRFMDSVIKDENCEWKGTQSEKLEQEIYNMLGLKKLNNDWVDSGEISSKSLVNKTKFLLLKRKDGSYPSKENRKTVARCFYNYVVSKR